MKDIPEGRYKPFDIKTEAVEGKDWSLSVLTALVDSFISDFWTLILGITSLDIF